MINKSINIVSMENIIGVVGLNLLGYFLSSMDRNQASCMIDCVEMDSGDVRLMAGIKAWADNPHPSVFIRLSQMDKPADNCAQVLFTV